MNIALIASDSRKLLMAELCSKYYGMFSNHHLVATAVTAKFISDMTGLEVESLLPGERGGEQQIASRIACNEIDLVFLFRGWDKDAELHLEDFELIRMCSSRNIPLATNSVTAEILIKAYREKEISEQSKAD